MLKRTLTGIFIIAVMVGTFLLRQFVDYRLFNILIYAFAVIGTFEITRAFKDRLTFFSKCIVWAYALTVIPVMTFVSGSAWRIVTFAAFVLAISDFVIEFKTVTAESVAHTLLACFYPTGLLVAMTAINGLGEQGFVPLLLVFITASFSDTFAYFVGSLIKGKKLCPNISPKKTISGFIGGFFGGALGAVLVWLVFPAAKGVFIASDLEWIIYFAIGMVASAVSAFGDLVEGGLKRKLGIKDLGNLLPGHGGILDRIDSTMFTAVLICSVFVFILS